MLIDARKLANGTGFQCDVCVIGSGPAGISIVDRLRGSNLSVILVESGGFEFDLPTQSLYRGEIEGDPYFRLEACRWRLFGGTTNRWGGWCRPLDPIDFTDRAWVANSGWPIRADTLIRYHDAAAALFQLPNAHFDLKSWQNRLAEPFSLDDSEFENAIFQFSPETNFGQAYRSRIISEDNTKILIYANVTELVRNSSSDSVGLIKMATLTGRTMIVRPKIVVLAAGGIENARLLLSSPGDGEHGLGNEFDNVGRYFIEHLHVPVGHMLATEQASSLEFYRKAIYGDAKLRGIIVPSQRAQIRHRLPGTSIAMEPESYTFGTPFVGWSPKLTFWPVRQYNRLREGRFGTAVERFRRVVERVYAIPIKCRTARSANAARARLLVNNPKGQIHSIYFRSEQAPEAGNRVVLSNGRDALGLRQVKLSWKVSESDRSAIRNWLDVLDHNIRVRGLGQIIPPAEGWEQGIIGGPHHMGTTRMSLNSRRGVVDSDCRVHSVKNLYVAGSSVFPTGGYANPTFTIVTLSLRLADTIRRKLESAPAITGSVNQ